MRLFENKVGRPTNEVLKKRRIFTLAIVLGVILTGGLVSFGISNIPTKKLSGEVPGTRVVTSFGDQTLSPYLVAPTDKDVYYKWFTYTDGNYKSNKPYYANKTCTLVHKATIAYIYPKLKISLEHPKRAGRLKSYYKLSDCNNDKNGTSTKNLYRDDIYILKYSGIDVSVVSASMGSNNFSNPTNITTNKTGTLKTSIKLTNNTNRVYFYRWITRGVDKKGKTSYHVDGCYKLTAKTTKYSKPSLDVTAINKERKGFMAIYESSTLCKADKNGEALSGVIDRKVINVHYKR